MMTFTLRELADRLGGRVVGGDAPVRGMIHDARQVEPGNLFCALGGARRDGHEFLAQARSNGAAAAMVQREVDDELPQLVVDDVVRAMGEAAAAWRRQLPARVVGITGSNGKTTVKEMIAAIVGRRGAALSTQGNYNNEIGVPLTLARLSEGHDYAIIEMGCGQPGDIGYLAGIADPDIGVVTNAGPAHLERLGSIEGVARTKGELFAALGREDTAVINADDRFAGLWRELSGAGRVISFGIESPADVGGRLERGRAWISTPHGEVDFAPRLPGRHNVYNALAAIAVAVALDLPLDEAAASLEHLETLPGRFQARHHPDGWSLIDDTYNANPASLYAGLQVLAEMGGEHWLVLGDMGELGDDAERLHAEMGEAAADLGVERLLTVGDLARYSAEAFASTRARHFDSLDTLVEALSGSIRPGVICLVKGSRSMGMERVVEALLGEASAC